MMVKYDPILKKILPNYKRVDSNNGRYYFDPLNDKKLPSVTSILSKTMKKEKRETLDNWKMRVGEEEAERVIKESTDIGSLVHRYIERYILGEDISENIKRKNFIYQKAYNMAKKIIDNEISEWDVVLGSEVELCYPGLYGGTVDLVFIRGNKIYIGDFKTSKNIKKEEYIKDYQLQIAAYALAINEHKIEDLHIKNGKIIMIDRDENLKVWEYNGTDMKKFEEEWIERLNEFYKK